jgi:hypothetical protein
VRRARGRGGISPPQKSTPARRAKKFSGKSKVWLAVFFRLYACCFPVDGTNKTQIQPTYYSKFGVFRLACSQTLWKEIVPRRVWSSERLALLEMALGEFDRANQARQDLDKEGLTIRKGKGGLLHAHPLLKVERDSRQLFARIWSELGLNAVPTQLVMGKDAGF